MVLRRVARAHASRFAMVVMGLLLLIILHGRDTAALKPVMVASTERAASPERSGAVPLGSEPVAPTSGPAPSPSPGTNVYASTIAGQLSPAVAGIPERVYVPNSDANTVTVIDPGTLQAVNQFKVGAIPHHITPAWDLSQLYVSDEASGRLTVIDPRSQKPIHDVPVTYPYNLYFVPDGSRAVLVAERLSRIEFRDPQTWMVLKTVDIPWRGIDHLDFSADGRYLLGTTEWSGMVVKIDTQTMTMVGSLQVGGYPIDVRLSPDGSVFYVTNQIRDGVSVVDGDQLKEVQFIPTGRGAHGLQVSRDTTRMYVSNRLAGSISVIDVSSRAVVATWHPGGSPDMFQLSPDGRQLWVSERFNSAVAVIDTSNGQLIKRIVVGAGAHGLSYFPNAGSHSLGHNGVYR